MTTVLLAFAFLLLLVPGEATLYGYYTDATSSGLAAIDPQTGASKVVCDLSSLPPLSGGSSSSYTTANELLFYTINASTGNISLVIVNPTTCKTTTTLITGLAAGQNDVRDIKYDSINNMLYMVFPNPFCMHGSLDKINVATATVVSHLTNVVDPIGLSQTAGLDGKSGAYYFVGIPLGADTIDYQLNKVVLATGNITTVSLANNNLDVGDMWGSNFTLNVVYANNGVNIVGAVTPSTTTVKECSPSGFYNINSATGNVTCVNGPIEYSVYPLAELDSTTLYYYQLFNDASYNFFLYTFDTLSNKVVYTTPCEMCSKLSVLAALP